MKKYYLVGSVILLLISVQTTYSVNLQWLKYSPVRYFTEQDWEMAKKAADEVLNHRSIGEALSWKNPDTGNSGDSMVTGTSEKDGKACKTLQITSRARNHEGKSNYLFCKQSDGTWKVDTTNPN